MNIPDENRKGQQIAINKMTNMEDGIRIHLSTTAKEDRLSYISDRKKNLQEWHI